VASMSVSNGADQVDAAITEILITFNHTMKSGMTVMRTDAAFPGNGNPGRWAKDKRTFSFPVKLDPGKKYGFALNSKKVFGFCNESGVPLYPTTVVFSTRPAKNAGQ